MALDRAVGRPCYLYFIYFLLIKSNKHILKEKLLSFVKIKDNKNLESIKTDKNNFIFYENLIINIKRR